MSLVYLGELTIGAAVPGVMAPLLAAMGDLQGRIDAMLGFSATIGLPIEGLLALSATVTASLSQPGLAAPSVALQMQIMASAIAVLKAQLTIIADLVSLLATAGVHAYAYDGSVGGLGAEVTSALSGGLPGGGGGGAHCNGLVAATTAGATWAAMGAVFKVAA